MSKFVPGTGVFTREMVIAQGLDKLEYVKIPEGYNELGEAAFKDNLIVKEVWVADSMEVIGKHAFDGCSNILKIRLPKWLKTMMPYAFYNCGTNAPNGEWIMDQEYPTKEDMEANPLPPHPGLDPVTGKPKRMEDIPGVENVIQIRGVGYETKPDGPQPAVAEKPPPM